MKRALWAGAVFGTVAFIGVFFISPYGNYGRVRVLSVAVTLAAAVLGFLIWLPVVTRGARMPGGAVAGFFIALTAHPLGWFFAVYYTFVFGAPVRAGQNAIGAADLAEVTRAAWYVGGSAVVYNLILVVFAGALVGALLAAAQERHRRMRARKFGVDPDEIENVARSDSAGESA